MQTFFEILGRITTIAGLIFLFVDIKDKKSISIHAAVCIILGISIIVVGAFCISPPPEQKDVIEDQTLESSNGPLHSDPDEPSQTPILPPDYSNQPDDSDLNVTTAPDNTNNNVTSTSGTVTNQPNKSGDSTGNGGQAVEPLVTVHRVKLDYEELELTVGNTAILSATAMYSNGTNDHSVAWLSSNPSVASVDSNGKIIALSTGITIISAQASINNTTQSKDCIVTVLNPPTEPTGYSIRLSTNHATIDEVFKLYVIPYEDDITEIHIYTISPSGKYDDFPLSDDGKYRIDTETGTWTIYASVTNSAGTYMAQRAEDYVTIEIISIGDTIVNWFQY